MRLRTKALPVKKQKELYDSIIKEGYKIYTGKKDTEEYEFFMCNVEALKDSLGDYTIFEKEDAYLAYNIKTGIYFRGDKNAIQIIKELKCH